MILPRPAILPAYLVLCLLLGGASAGGYPANLALQLGAVGLILWALLPAPENPLARQERFLLMILAAGCLVVALQFLPLPPALWEALPRRAAVARIDRIAGVAPGPGFLTLMPHESLKSAVWLLPAVGLLLAMLRRPGWRAEHFAWTILAVMALSVLLGAVQLAGGPASRWYVYDITNRGSTVGFFANSNHLATLLLVSLPFLAALVGRARAGRQSAATGRAVMLAAGGAFLGVALIGIFVNGSLFGYGLVLPVSAASLLFLVPRPGLRRISAALLVPVVAAGIALVLASDEGRHMLAQSSALSPGGRDAIFANSWAAIRDFMPTGSGLGSFAEIYRHYEDPAQASLSYINHAHNDYLELLLETGVPGGLVLAAFLLWWGARAFRIWHARRADPFACAAVVASATILIHSIVDYPLRTAAIGSIFALCCALMAGSREKDR